MTNRRQLRPLLAAAFITMLALVTALPSAAETPEEKGQAIAEEAERRERGFGDSASALEMVLRNRNGDESRRALRIKVLESEEGDRSMVIFDTPADVKGTALLTAVHEDAPNDQWLYLPAIKRVKRIASKNKSGPFMGSEFAFEDMGSQDIDKFTHVYLRDETLDGADCFVLERTPTDKDSGYTKQTVWIDKDEYRFHKVDYYDRRGDLLKTLQASKWERQLDKYWRPLSVEMVNHQSGKSTTLRWSDFKFGNGFTERDFDVNSLKRAR